MSVPTTADAPASSASASEPATSAAPASSPAPTAPKPSPPAQPDEDLNRWKALSRQNETRWNQATSDLEKAKQELADRDLRISDLSASSASDVATAKLERALVRAGMDDEQIDSFVKFLDPKRLLKDGKPDAEAIKAVAGSIPASLRTGPPDPDQGRGGSQRPADMNSWIRQAAGIQA